MEKQNKKCSFVEHKDLDVNSFCQECKLFLCNKCEKQHLGWFNNHHQVNLDKNIDEIFTGFCKEKNHFAELKYFCKTHNKLCCGECIAKIKDDENGKHTDCDICVIKDIENEKRKKLKENIQKLEELSENFQKSIDELKKIFENINVEKDNMKINVQKIFTKMRNTLNNREEELLLEIDTKFNKIFFNEDIVRNGEKLPNRIISSIQKGKNIDEQWGKNKLNSLINDCLIIEKNISEVNKINENISKYNSFHSKIIFNPEENEINNFLETMRNFGAIQEITKKFDSNIEFDQDLVKSWLNNRDFTSSLLFRKTRDGSKITDFHNKCDNKGITILLQKAINLEDTLK